MVNLNSGAIFPLNSARFWRSTNTPLTQSWVRQASQMALRRVYTSSTRSSIYRCWPHCLTEVGLGALLSRLPWRGAK